MARKTRNRKRKKVKEAMPPAHFAGIVIVGSALALVYVWLGCLCESVGREIKDLERRKDTLTKRLAVEETKWACMKSPWNVERELAKYGIVMRRPTRNQVVVFNDMQDFYARIGREYREIEGGAGNPEVRSAFGAGDSLHLANMGRIVMNE